jgi:hypothetical protein
MNKFFKSISIDKVVTHHGQPHRDDWLAVSLACFVFGVAFDRVFRGLSREKWELGDPKVIVLDVGEMYDPFAYNWDHHQLNPKEGRCAVEMLLESVDPEWHAGMMKDPREGERSYLKSVALQDSLGWRKAQELGAQPQSLFESDMVKLFGGTDEERAIALTAGVAFWRRRREAFVQRQATEKFVRENELQWMVVLGTSIPIFPSPPEGLTGWQLIAAYEEKRGWSDHEPPVIVFPDDRGPGWSVLRRNDAPDWDFSGLASDDRVEFAHKGGFIMKTKKRLSLQFLTRLIALGSKELQG